MRLRRLAYLIFGMVLLLNAPRAQTVSAEEPAPTVRRVENKATLGGKFDVESTKDITYYKGEDEDAEKHKLDIYIPKGKKDFPVLFFIHGGSWQTGDRKLYGPLASVFARNGVGAVVISYRLSPKVQHPAHIEDVARAFAWTVKNIGNYGGNPKEIFVSGHSAGGHLAALLATNERFLKEEKLDRSSIKGVIPLSGIYMIPPGLMPNVFGKEAKDASPLLFIPEKLPPFLIGYADKDMKNFDTMAEEFGKALKAKKLEATTVKIDERTHFTIIIRAAISETDPCTAAMLDFIARQTGRELVKKDTK